jgi:thioredoxin 1
MYITELTAETIEDFIKSKEVSIIDFWATFCMPCKALANHLDFISQKSEGDIHIAKLNIQNYPEIAAKYNIISVPHLIAFRNGKQVDYMTGFKNKESLDQFIIKNTGVTF